MAGRVRVHSWVGITGDVPVHYSRNTRGRVDIMFGDARGEYFEFGCDAASLREFIRVGTEALGHLESRPESS